jgi:hypothetical protein
MRLVSTLNVLLFGLLVSGIHAAIAAEEFKQAEPAISSDFNVTGFTNIVAEAPSGGKIKLIADDLGFFVDGHINRLFNPFFEAEIAGSTLVQVGPGLSAANPSFFLLERIYNESYLTNSLSLRIGKILSPVGEWNLIHVPPLVLTTTRPMTTYRGFSEFSSGFSVLYADTRGVLPDVQLYVQPANAIAPRPISLVAREYMHITGFHLNKDFGLNDKLGLSIQHAQVKDTGEQQTLTGFNFGKEIGHLAFETEAFHTRITSANVDRLRNNEWGYYLQGAYALTERWNLVGRHESFADRGFTIASENALLGVTCKLARSSIWKLEYIKQSGQLLDINTGLYGSYSVLF